MEKTGRPGTNRSGKNGGAVWVLETGFGALVGPAAGNAPGGQARAGGADGSAGTCPDESGQQVSRHRRMIRDPELTGDLLLLALALDELLVSREEQNRDPFGKRWTLDVEELARGQRRTHRGWWVKVTIAADLPRYEPAQPAVPECVAPMVRREGPCGKRTTAWGFVDVDPETGEGRQVWLCGRHRELGKQFDARRREWITNGRPSPPPNAGGVLRRYFDGDWAMLYRWAAGCDPLEGEREMVPPKPVLKLIQGGSSPA